MTRIFFPAPINAVFAQLSCITQCNTPTTDPLSPLASPPLPGNVKLFQEALGSVLLFQLIKRLVRLTDILAQAKRDPVFGD